MLDVNCNFKNGKSSLLCRKCLSEDEKQKHLLSCKSLNDNSLINSYYIPSYEDISGTKKHCNIFPTGCILPNQEEVLVLLP